MHGTHTSVFAKACPILFRLLPDFPFCATSPFTELCPWRDRQMWSRAASGLIGRTRHGLRRNPRTRTGRMIAPLGHHAYPSRWFTLFAPLWPSRVGTSSSSRAGSPRSSRGRAASRAPASISADRQRRPLFLHCPAHSTDRQITNSFAPRPSYGMNRARAHFCFLFIPCDVAVWLRARLSMAERIRRVLSYPCVLANCPVDDVSLPK